MHIFCTFAPERLLNSSRRLHLIMADNYLERRMDDYRAGRLSRQQRPAKRRRPLRTFLLLAEAGDLTAAVIDALRRDGTVVWCPSDDTAARDMANRHGARLYPSSPDAIQRAVADCQHFDATVTIDKDTFIQATDCLIRVFNNATPTEMPDDLRCNDIIHTDDNSATACTVRLLTNPDARYVSGLQIAPKNFSTEN